MKPIYAILLLMFLSQCVLGQAYEWTRTFGGNNYHDEPRDIQIDNAGNVYTCGSFALQVDFDPGAGTYYLSSPNSTAPFVHKMDDMGNLIWAKAFASDSNAYANAIAVDDDKNVFICGHFRDTTDFDPGPGVSNHIPNGYEEIFIVKLDSNGEFVWAKSIGNEWTNIASTITVDEAGNSYISGYFHGKVDFDPGTNTLFLDSPIGTDMFILKLNPQGDFIWVKSVIGTGYIEPNDMILDDSQNLLITGSYQNTRDFDSGADSFLLPSKGSFEDIFILKMDSSGSLVWVKSMGETGSDVGNSITTDYLGNIYTTGVFMGTVDFDPGPGVSNLTWHGTQDIFIQKLDSNGKYIWAKSFGGIFESNGNGITTDNMGNVFATGTYSTGTDFDPGSGIYNLNGPGWKRSYILKLNSNGYFLWATNVSGNNELSGTKIQSGKDDAIYTLGYYGGAVDFSFSSPSDMHVSNGGRDVFIHKMQSSVTSNINDLNNQEVLVYPNPSNGSFIVKLNKSNNQVRFKVFDVLGKEISFQSHKNIDYIQFELNPPSGIYFLVLYSNKTMKTVRIVIK